MVFRLLSSTPQSSPTSFECVAFRGSRGATDIPQSLMRCRKAQLKKVDHRVRLIQEGECLRYVPPSDLESTYADREHRRSVERDPRRKALRVREDVSRSNHSHSRGGARLAPLHRHRSCRHVLVDGECAAMQSCSAADASTLGSHLFQSLPLFLLSSLTRSVATASTLQLSSREC